MSFQYTPYIWFYLSGAVMIAIIAAYEAYKRVGNRLLTLTQVMAFLWCLGVALQISGADLKTEVVWYLFANDFVGFKIPVIWLLWTLVVAGRESWITRRRIVLLLGLPLVTDVLNLTNPWHGLMYPRWHLNTSGRYPLLEYLCGPWYWVITVYCGIVLLAVIVIQLKAALKRELLYRKHGLFVAGATTAVLLAIVLFFTMPELRYPHDLTPVTVSIAVVSSSLVSRFRDQEAVPVPRNMVLEKMTNAALILDNHNRIMDLNPAAEAFFGLKIAKAAGCVFGEALSGWPELVAAGQGKSDSRREFSRNGRHYEAVFSGLRDGYKTAGRLVVVQDVTAVKKATAQLVEQQQALLVLQERERLARELHDSLGQVLGYTQIQIKNIREMLKTGELSMVDDSLARLSQVILEANAEVREFIYEVKATLQFKDGFFATLQQYLARFERNFKIRIEAHNPDGLVEEEIDLTAGVQLFRIIQEALTNVRKHARAGKVTITFRKEEQQIQVIVADNGIGFDPGSRPAGRLSFGLEVMQERAAQVGGDVRIDAAPGRGTMVIINIPRLTQRRSRPKPGEETAAEGAKPGIRVLLADDHVLFMEGLQNLIRPRGFEVVGTARDGLEALVKARLLHPEMILMDLTMPRCNGLTAVRLIKAEMPEIKIVILTMSDQEQDLLEAIKNGAAGYLLKGLRSEDLIEQLIALAHGAATLSPEMAAQVLQEFYQNKGGRPATPVINPVGLERILSPRQIEILRLMAGGYIYKEVAAKLFVSERTVKYEMAEILKQLHLQTRAQAIAYARQVGLGKKPAGG